jgi:hypothetical protein
LPEMMDYVYRTILCCVVFFTIVPELLDFWNIFKFTSWYADQNWVCVLFKDFIVFCFETIQEAII